MGRVLCELKCPVEVKVCAEYGTAFNIVLYLLLVMPAGSASGTRAELYHSLQKVEALKVEECPREPR